MAASQLNQLTGPEESAMKLAGIVLCGGRSSRMGRPKADLPFGQEVMLSRVVRLLRSVVDPIVVVAAPHQRLPAVTEGVEVVRDRHEYRGPLEGICRGLNALQGRADAAYATACDVPLLVPAFVDKLRTLLGDDDVAVPVEGRYHHPLAAIYRTRVLPDIEQLLGCDQLRPVFLYERVDTRKVPVDMLRDVDPQLQTLRNINTPEEYEQLLRLAFDTGTEENPQAPDYHAE
jgi:molybdopterin-guanine dinucleotide biosynthesis protein A